jgi:hypothetical protein
MTFHPPGGRGTPGRTLEAMVIRRLYYDMHRYSIVQDYLASRRRGYQRAARVAKQHLDQTHQFSLEHSYRTLDRCGQIIESDLDALTLSVKPIIFRRRLDRPFSDSPEYLKTFDFFL